jgi:ABC-type phosphate transport system substrate-binding protein
VMKARRIDNGKILETTTLSLTLGLLLLSAVLVSCHNKSEEDLPVSMPDTIRLNGAGATFPYPIYSKWFDEYRRLRPGVASTISRSVPAEASDSSQKEPSISGPAMTL